VDLNPFAPPRTTDLDPPSADGPPGEVEPAALEALAGAGRWALWSAVLGAVCAGGSLLRAVSDGRPLSGSMLTVLSTLSLPVLGLVALLTFGFARATGRFPLDDAALEECARRQHQVFAAQAFLVFLLAATAIAGAVIGLMTGLGRRP
jgi:hypothetical protein